MKKPSIYLAKEYAEFVDCYRGDNDPLSKWAQRLLHAAFSDFAEGYWTLAVVEADMLEWRCPATWDEPPVEMTFTPEMLVEAFKTRIRIDEPFHPEDYGHLKDAIAKWRRAIEQVEERLAKTKVKSAEGQPQQ